MAKSFNVEQLRLNGLLLTGNSSNELYYGGLKLANGDSAVPLNRLIVAGDGLKHSDKATDSLDLSANRTLHVMTDESTIDINAADKLYIPTGGVNVAQIHANVAGAGLAGGGGTNPLSVVGGSGIVVASDAVNIPKSGVTNAMLSGSIQDTKLNNIVSPGKVEGSAIQLNGTTLADLGGNGLALNTNSVGTAHIQAAVAGSGLAGGHNGTAGVALRVGAGAGISVDTNTVGIDTDGVVNSMILNGTITDAKLATITTSNKVDGSAVQLNGNGIEDNVGLGIKNSGILGTMIHPNAAGAGLGGGGVADALVVNAGSGMKVADDNVNIDESGVITSMLRDGNVTSAKLAGSIGWSKLGLTAGDGLAVNTNDLYVDLKTNGGLEFAGGKLGVDNTVVSALDTVTQTLSGNYTFAESVVMSSGLTVNGNLQVQGQTLVTQQNQVNIGDDIIVLNADYPSNTPPDAGIEIERGTLTNSKLLFDDVAGSYGNDLVWKAGIGNNLYRIDTKEFTRVYGTELASGINQKKLAFGHTFGSVPKVVVSLEHTGEYGVSNPDLMAAMVTKVYTTGVWVDFSAPTNASGYYLNVHAAVV